MKSLTKKRIVVIGGGIAGLTFISNFAKWNRSKDFEIILIDAKEFFLWKPLLYHIATGSLSHEHICVKYKLYSNQLGIKFINSNVTEMNFKDKFIKIYDLNNNSKKIIFDYLILSLGSISQPNIKFNNLHCIDTLQNCLKLKAEVEKLILKKGEKTVVIIGGGCTGVEFCCDLRHLFRVKNIPNLSLTLITASNRLVTEATETLSQAVYHELCNQQVSVILNDEVLEENDGLILTKNGLRIKGDLIVWAGGIQPVNCLANMVKLKKADNNFILTNKFTQSESFDNIFAIGDCSTIPYCVHKGKQYFVPARGSAAYQSGYYLAKSFLSIVNKQKCKNFKYKQVGLILSLGTQSIGNLLCGNRAELLISGFFSKLLYYFIIFRTYKNIFGWKQIFLMFRKGLIKKIFFSSKKINW